MSKLTNREKFQHWLIQMDDRLDEFFAILPDTLANKLDFSPGSLNYLEAWILENYENSKDLLRKEEDLCLDGIARYIGETFRKSGGGVWKLYLDDPKNAFYGLPVLIGFCGKSTPICPITLATASVARRKGNFLSGILSNNLLGRAFLKSW